MKKKIIITIFLIMLLLIPKSSFAYEWRGGVDGVGGYVSSCSSNNYCYSMVGLRVSLYKMSGNNANKVGRSHDYWKTLDSDGTNQNDPKDHGSSDDLVSSLFNDNINDKKRNNLIPNAGRFNVLLSNYRRYDSTMVTYLGNQWKYDYRNEESGESSRFISWMNNKSSNAMFQTLDEYDELKINLGLDDAEKNDVIANNGKYYLVVETLFGIWVGSNSILPPSGGFERGRYYIGTLYELNAFTTRFGGMQLYAEALISPNSVGNFVGNDSSSIIRTSKSNDSVTQNYIKNNYAIGMAVFNLSDIIIETTCKDVCGITPSLACAEDYCEKNRTTSYEKRTCMINECKRSSPPKLTCSNRGGGTTDSKCSEIKSNIKTTCTSETNSTYYKKSCTEDTTVTYPNDLPVIFYLGSGGFNYSVATTGKRLCTYEFNKSRFEFEYAALLQKDRGEASTLKKVLKSFQNIEADNNTYSFGSEDSIKFAVDDGKFNTTSLKQIDNKTTIDKDETTSQTVYAYKDKLKLSMGNYAIKRTINSSNVSKFILDQQCYSLETGEVSKKTLLGKCGAELKIKNFAYYGYYSLLNNRDKIYTKTVTIKSDSGLHDTNKCYYEVGNPNDDFSCSILAEKVEPKKYKITYKVIKDRNGGLYTYKFDGTTLYDSSFTSEGTYTKLITLDDNKTRKINASITKKDGITKYCPVTITNVDDPKSEECTEKFEPVQYDDIRTYCNDNWKKDKAGYSSFSDCYNSCSSPGRNETCKSKYKCGQTTEINSYCELNYSKDGYYSTGACINDCSCKDEAAEYFYRPISLITPFPNRQPGSNWVGFLNNIKEDDFSGNNPEYVVELDKDKINSINADTAVKGGIGSTIFKYDGSYSNGVYKSNFINKYFTCKRGDC